MAEIHKPPNVKVIDEIWVGVSEDEDGKNGRRRLSPAVQGSQSEPVASVACGGSLRNGSRRGGQDRRHGSPDLARDWVHRFNAARPDGLFDNRRDGPTQTETSYDDLHRACRRRDPGCIDPLRHVFEDAMSGVILFAAALAFGAWLFFEMAIRM
jgi:hypothetical protein